MYEVKFENKNLIITDPCYLDNVMNDNDMTPELLKYWNKMCDYLSGDLCNGLSSFGFSNFICCGTKYGDWSCTTYRTDIDPTTLNTVEDLDKLAKEMTDKKPLGRFCADAGMVCVVDADELKKFNPNFFEWALFHPHCVTAINNFTGTVGIHDIDPKNEKFPHFRVRLVYGISDNEKYNFCSFQTGY